MTLQLGTLTSFDTWDIVLSSKKKNVCSMSSFRQEMIGITVGMSESAWECLRMPEDAWGCLRMPEDAWGCLRLSLNRFRPYLGSPKLYIIIVILESSSRQRGLNFGPVPLRRLGALRSWTYGQNAADTHFVSATGMHLKTLRAPTFSISQNAADIHFVFYSIKRNCSMSSFWKKW